MTGEQAGSLKTKLMLTYEELAEVSSLSVAYLKKLKKDGAIPFIPGLGKSVRFDPGDVVAWLKSRGAKTNVS